jgi:mRNA interferase MazF
LAVARGEVWTVSGGAYAGKPRPAVVVQADGVSGFASVTLVPCTTSAVDAPLLRPVLSPTTENGLLSPSRAMADKVTTIPRGNLGKRLGRIAPEDMERIERALALHLGLA